MDKIEPTTRQLILNAALDEFHAHGFKGARTGRIAAAAGIGRTMLHYYFNTKEALFEAVLSETFGAVIPYLQKMVADELDLFALVEQLTDLVADMLEENPGLPSFVVNMLNENPQLILGLLAFQQENTPGLLDTRLEKARLQGLVRPDVRGEDLLIDIWALCSTPYLLATYIAAKEQRDDAQMRDFIRERRPKILRLILSGIRV